MENEETIVAVYDTPAHAELAMGDLLEAKVPESAISRHQESATTGAAPVRERGFWASLFGGDAEDEPVYERSARSGSSVVVVKTPIHHADAVIAILESHHPVDLDERAESYKAASTYASPAAAAVVPPPIAGFTDPSVATSTSSDRVQFSEANRVSGKRLVNRGGTRLRRYVVETPVQAEESPTSAPVDAAIVTPGAAKN